MLISMMEVVSCENTRCNEFAKPVQMPRDKRCYYCHTCGSTSRMRGVDANIVTSPEEYREYLLSVVGDGAKKA